MSTRHPAESRVDSTAHGANCDESGESECGYGDGGGDFFALENSRINVNVHRSSKGNYLRHNISDTCCTLRILMLFVIFSSCTANIMGDQCDWSGNGLALSSSQSRGVTPVYLRCSQGRISWSYPRGALRVLLRLPNSDRDFRGCIKADPSFTGARLFLEGRRSLTPLFAPDDGAHKSLVRCFQSRKGQAAVYVEAADLRGDFKKEVASFGYDLRPVPKGSSAFDLVKEECRPCTKHEMAHAFCTSDLVTRGSIHSIDDKRELEIAEISVKVKKLLRHSTDDLSLIGDNGVEDSGENERDRRKIGENDIIKLNMPSHCHPEHGPGEFVFMGRKRLGDLTLVCAPSLSEWADVVRTMNSDGTSHCVLKS